MRWVFLIQFCVGCWYTIASGFQLSYTPRCGKELLFSFVEECVTASTGLPAKRYPQIKGCAEYFLFNFREGCVTASTGLPILPPCHASFSRRCALRAGAPPFPCGSNRAGAKCVRRTGENCVQEGARAGRTASRWSVRRTGENCVQGGARAGRAASRWSVRRTGKNCVQGGAAGRVASRRKRPARTGKISCRKARGPNGRQADGSVQRTGENCVQEGARAERAASRWERPARTGKGTDPAAYPFPCVPASPARKGPLRHSRSPRGTALAACADCAPCRAADQCCDAPVLLPLRRAPTARRVGRRPVQRCASPLALAACAGCAACRIFAVRLLPLPARTGASIPLRRRKSAAQPGADAPARSESNGCVSHKVYTIGPNVFTKVCYTNVHAWASMRFYVRGAFRRRITGRRARVAPRPSGQPPGEPFKEGFA